MVAMPPMPPALVLGEQLDVVPKVAFFRHPPKVWVRVAFVHPPFRELDDFTAAKRAIGGKEDLEDLVASRGVGFLVVDDREGGQGEDDEDDENAVFHDSLSVTGVATDWLA